MFLLHDDYLDLRGEIPRHGSGDDHARDVPHRDLRAFIYNKTYYLQLALTKFPVCIWGLEAVVARINIWKNGLASIIRHAKKSDIAGGVRMLCSYPSLMSGVSGTSRESG